jgi:hypothetical protein
VYRALRDELNERYGTADWVALPGNHDRRTLGNFGLAKAPFDEEFPDWKAPWWRLGVPLLVIPLDSNPDPDEGRTFYWGFALARGVLGAENQRIGSTLADIRQDVLRQIAALLEQASADDVILTAARVSTAFDTMSLKALAHARAESVPLSATDDAGLRARLAAVLCDLFIARAVKCLALHHHPLSIPYTEGDGLTDQDAYLALIDSGTLLNEARRHHISLICHGHRHMPHRMSVGLPALDAEPVGIVGCGSTTFGNDSVGASANIIDISASGTVNVDLFRLKDTSWQTSGQTLRLRSWPDVKRALARAARDSSELRCRKITCEVTITQGGDALVTTSFEGIRPTRSHAEATLFLLMRSSTFPRVPRFVAAASRDIADFRLDEVAATGAVWAGLAKFSIQPDKEDGRLTLQAVDHCLFATNKWQLRGLYGRADAQESYVRHCSIPAEESVSLTVRVSDLVGEGEEPFYFDHVARKCTDMFDQRDEAELSAMELHESPTGTQIRTVATHPVWGNAYGISWRWEGAPGPTHDDLEQQMYMLFAAELDGRAVGRDASPFRVQMEQVFGRFESAREVDRVPEIEVCFYGLEHTSSRLRLRQLASNAAIRSVGLQAFDLPFGVGVAGRCAWTAEVTPWVADSNPEDEMGWSDFYYPEGTVRHRAVLAFPVSLGMGRAPVGVLSLATRRDDPFADAVRRLINDADAGVDSSLPACVLQVLRDSVLTVQAFSNVRKAT